MEPGFNWAMSILLAKAKQGIPRMDDQLGYTQRQYPYSLGD